MLTIFRSFLYQAKIALNDPYDTTN